MRQILGIAAITLFSISPVFAETQKVTVGQIDAKTDIIILPYEKSLITPHKCLSNEIAVYMRSIDTNNGSGAIKPACWTQASASTKGMASLRPLDINIAFDESSMSHYQTTLDLE